MKLRRPSPGAGLLGQPLRSLAERWIDLPVTGPAPLRARREMVAVVDPGSVNLRLLITEVLGAEATVQGWEERPGSLEVGADAPYLELMCEEALARAEAEAADRARRSMKATHMLVGLPGRQLRGWAWTYGQRRNRPDRPVETRELEGLLRRALRRTVNRLRGNDHDGWLLVDAAPVALTIDNQGVTDPVGFRGTRLGATVFAAVARAETVAIWRQVAGNLGFATLTLCVAPLALAARRPEPQAILMDVGGAGTDLVWHRAGRPLALASLPSGGESLTLALRRKWGLAADKAEQLKRTYSGAQLGDDAAAHVREAILPAVLAWREHAETRLADMSHSAGCPLPQQVYLLGGGSLLPEIYEAARSLAYSEQLTFDRYPQMEWLQPTAIAGVVNRSSRGRSAADVTALALAAWAAVPTCAQAPQAGGSAGGARHEDRPTRILSDLCHA